MPPLSQEEYRRKARMYAIRDCLLEPFVIMDIIRRIFVEKGVKMKYPPGPWFNLLFLVFGLMLPFAVQENLIFLGFTIVMALIGGFAYHQTGSSAAERYFKSICSGIIYGATFLFLMPYVRDFLWS